MLIMAALVWWGGERGEGGGERGEGGEGEGGRGEGGRGEGVEMNRIRSGALAQQPNDQTVCVKFLTAPD